MTQIDRADLEADAVATIIGASGGIGSALLARISQDPRFARVLALSRGPVTAAGARVVTGPIDLENESTIEAAAAQCRALGTLRLVIVASGMLHCEGIQPEKHWGALRADALSRSFAVNAIGPALVGKHFLPLLPRAGRSVFAAVSARVGSIQDNRLGGWHAYRSSKAALNMLLKGFAIELARQAPQALCVGLHPGTVDTALSRPFQGNVPEDRLFTPTQAAGHLLEVIDRLGPADSGNVYAWDGTRVPA